MINIAIDVETTGLIPGIHGVCALGAVLFDDEFNETARFYTKIKPENAIIDPKAMSVNKLTDLQSFPSPGTARRDFFCWLDEVTNGSATEKIFALGHNYYFDKGFLINLLNAQRYDQLFYYKVRDTFVVAQFLKDLGKIPQDQSLSLTELCKYYKIKPGEHDALGDASATLQLYKELMGEI